MAGCGSLMYWFVTALTVPWILLFYLAYKKYLLQRQVEKAALSLLSLLRLFLPPLTLILFIESPFTSFHFSLFPCGI